MHELERKIEAQEKDATKVATENSAYFRLRPFLKNKKK